MKVHVGSDEKASTFFRLARFEFLHSLQVVFQFINTTSVLGIRASLFGGELSSFGFSRVVPFQPAAMKSFFKFIFVSVYLVLDRKFFIQNIKAVKFSFSRVESNCFFRNSMKLAHCSFLDTRQSSELVQTHTMT